MCLCYVRVDEDGYFYLEPSPYVSVTDIALEQEDVFSKLRFPGSLYEEDMIPFHHRKYDYTSEFILYPSDTTKEFDESYWRGKCCVGGTHARTHTHTFQYPFGSAISGHDAQLLADECLKGCKALARL